MLTEDSHQTNFDFETILKDAITVEYTDKGRVLPNFSSATFVAADQDKTVESKKQT